MSLKRFLAGLGLAAPAPRPPAWGLYDTPLHLWLDAAGFPWRVTRAELARLYGVQPDPANGLPVLAVPTPILDGLLHPLAASADERYPLSVPAAEYSGRVSVGDDARANLRHVADQLVPHLGPTRLGDRNDTFRAEWVFGRASLTLVSWPADLNRHHPARNDAYDRDPRLKGSCFIRLKTGFRPTPSPAEQAWLESFTPIARIRTTGSPASMRAAQVSDLDLGLVRELPDGLERIVDHIGLSGDGQALIAGDRVLWLAPLSQVAGFRIDQYRPGRSGPGGPRLMAELHPEQPAGGLKPVGISWEGPDSAEELGEKLAAATGRPLEIVDAGTED
jgi:hypothetical protein